MLALHATAEGLVLRSATKRAGDGQGSEVAGARNQEETDANEVLQDLESLEVGSAEFHEKLAAFEKAVDSPRRGRGARGVAPDPAGRGPWRSGPPAVCARDDMEYRRAERAAGRDGV